MDVATLEMVAAANALGFSPEVSGSDDRKASTTGAIGIPYLGINVSVP
jgi:hypothetical protein